MIDFHDYLEAGYQFHGHKCPAMPLGLRAAAAAMNKLGVERTGDKDLVALVELGDGHFATCYSDGVQMMTGCTVGKCNIRLLNYGKWGLTLVDRKTDRAVRVIPRADNQLRMMQTDFFRNYRMKGVPATQVPEEIATPLINHVLEAPDEKLFAIGEVHEYHYQMPPHVFTAFVCEQCGELTVETYGRLKDGKKLCIPCAEAGNGLK